MPGAAMNTTARTDVRPLPVLFALGWHLAWCAVLVVNLPVPLLLGCAFGSHAEFREGIFAAILTALVLGHFVIASLRPFRGVLVCGGLCVALSQVFFVPHFFAGLVALHLVGTFVQPAGDFGTGFWLTLATGGVLMPVVLTFGFPFYGLGTRTETGSGRP
jgi:hypothetical protein